LDAETASQLPDLRRNREFETEEIKI